MENYKSKSNTTIIKNSNYINDYLKNLSLNLFSLDVEKFSLLIKKFNKIKQKKKKLS